MKQKLVIIAPILFLLLLVEHINCFAQTGWFTIQSGLQQTNDLFFPTSDTGYIVGNDGLARKSTDGGFSWQTMKLETDYKGKADFVSVSFPTPQVGYIAGNELSGFGIILKTTDAGNTWVKTSYSFPYFIDKIIFPSASVGYITTDFTPNSTGTVYMLIKSKDGGNLWGTLDSSLNVKIEQMVWKTENLGLFTSNHLGDPPESYLRYTSDGGNKILFAGTTQVIDKTTVGSGDGNVWYCGINYRLSRSEDTNFHWTITNGAGNLEYGTFFISNGDSSYCIANGYPGLTIFKTADNGLNWFDQFKDTTLSPIAGYAPTLRIAYLLASYDSSRKWKILKTIDGGGAPLNEVNNYLYPIFSLSPNPTTGIITMHNAPANILHVTIMNVLGETVSEANGSSMADFSIDLSKLPPGIYYARFVMPNSVTMRKIVRQ